MNRGVALALVLGATAPALPQEKIDWAMVGRIRDEGFRHSQVMGTAAQLTDVLGPRLTGSPGYRKAAEWSRQQLESWGLANAHLESWPFGRGWSFERCSAHIVSPLSFAYQAAMRDEMMPRKPLPPTAPPTTPAAPGRKAPPPKASPQQG